jgi:hypothetical protein
MVQPVSSDRMELLFAAAHESACGTFRKCRSRCVMSAHRGKPEVIGKRRKRREGPGTDFALFEADASCLGKRAAFHTELALCSRRSNIALQL